MKYNIIRLLILVLIYANIGACSLIKGKHGIEIKAGCLPINFLFTVQGPGNEGTSICSGCFGSCLSFFGHQEKDFSKEDFKNIEDYLNACILSARKFNNNIEKYNKDFKRAIYNVDEGIKYYLYMPQGKNKRGYKKALKKADSMLNSALNMLELANEKILKEKNILNNEKQLNESLRTAFKFQINKMEKNRLQLKKLINLLKVVRDQNII